MSALKACFMFSVGLLLLSACANITVEPGHSVLLPPDSADSLRTLCSRPGLPAFQSTWQPSATDIAEMESQFGQLKHVSASQCCIPGARIRDVNKYYRQYVGIAVHDKKLIYINAYPIGSEQGLRSKVVAACDGGTGYWGVLYDVESHRFFDLAVNGLA